MFDFTFCTTLGEVGESWVWWIFLCLVNFFWYGNNFPHSGQAFVAFGCFSFALCALAVCQFRLSLNFPLTYLVTGGLTLFHQTEVVRAIPARSCCQGGDGGADMEHASGLGHKHLAYSDSSLSKFSGPFAAYLYIKYKYISFETPLLCIKHNRCGDNCQETIKKSKKTCLVPSKGVV